MQFVFDDGGRTAAGFKGTTGDCVCRAIAIASGMPYKEVYNLINEFGKRDHRSTRKSGRSSARTGVYKDTIKRIMSVVWWFNYPDTMRQLLMECSTIPMTAREMVPGACMVIGSRQNN